MTLTTNKKILKYSLLPMVGFWCFAFMFPIILEGTENPSFINYLGMALWVLGCLGVFIFWGWGVMPHVAESTFRPFEAEAEKGWLVPNGHGERALRVFEKFKALNIYIEPE